MENNLMNKVNRLNELYLKIESGNELSAVELNERAILRDEIINYFKFTIDKLKGSSSKNT
ncbi:MAG: hypothetical protein J6M39_04130 [Lachnospiraceae bacterium]|nr:hypothetical protein [Lachnospiraceae bacterium]